MAPPPQRPFFANFLAAFRAHSATTPSSPSAAAARSLTTKHTSSATTTRTSARHAASTNAAASTSCHSSSSSSTTTTQQQQSTNMASNPYQSHPSQDTSPRAPMTQGNITARRRGSDSSSEGFRDVLGGEKWYIGGRTTHGDERYYRLGVVRRRSGGSLSLDRLSL